MRKAGFLVAVLACCWMASSCNNHGGQTIPAAQQNQAVEQAQPATGDAVMGDDDRQVALDNLPQEAKNLLSSNFAGKKVSVSTADNDDFTVRLESGEKIEFERNGNWTEIECYGTSVPAALVPQAIAADVKAAYKGAVITKLERNDNGGYEVSLNNGMEIKYSSSGRRIAAEVDD
jgi:hypothetical protein